MAKKKTLEEIKKTEFLTKAEFATLVGVSRATMTKEFKKPHPRIKLSENGLIHRETQLKAWNKNTNLSKCNDDTYQKKKGQKTNSEPISGERGQVFETARDKKEYFDAEKAEKEYLQFENTLVLRSSVQNAFGEIAGTLVANLEQVSARATDSIIKAVTAAIRKNLSNRDDVDEIIGKIDFTSMEEDVMETIDKEMNNYRKEVTRQDGELVRLINQF